MMLETKCVCDNFKMMIKHRERCPFNGHRQSKDVTKIEIQDLSSTTKNCHQLSSHQQNDITNITVAINSPVRMF